MNMLVKMKNYIVRESYRKAALVAITIAQKHIGDEDQTKFKEWANMSISFMKKCLEYT